MPLYATVWRGKLLPGAESLKDLVETLKREADRLSAMLEAGVSLESCGDDYYFLLTEDADVAKRFDMEEQIDEIEDDFEDDDFYEEVGE